MSFCTEDPDTVNASIADTLREMREQARRGELGPKVNKNAPDPYFGKVWADRPQPKVFSDKYEGAWTEDMHPKD